MAITIVQKSDLSVRKNNAKIALVLAGGAVTGGTYKLGGLKALNDYFVNRKMTDFDMYVGLSAGALLSAAIANGVSPEEMLKSLSGRSKVFSKLKAWDFYWPNWAEFITRPAKTVADVLTFSPLAAMVVAAARPEARAHIYQLAKSFLQHPSYENAEAVASVFFQIVTRHVEVPNPLASMMPTGFFNNARLEQYLRSNIKRAGGYNRFDELRNNTGKELYIVATNLDTAQRTIFGWDEFNEATISQAMQASTAIPGFYKPVRLGGEDFIDGGVRKTANIDVAIEKGADLIIAYNPFRPLVSKAGEEGDRVRRRIAREGIGSIINQVFRTLLHTRLHLGLEGYRNDPNFKGDIILLEPAPEESGMFDLNPVAFWQRGDAAQHGFESAIVSIEANFETVRPIARSYGIEMSRHYVMSELKRLHNNSAMTQNEIFDILEQGTPASSIRLASGE